MTQLIAAWRITALQILRCEIPSTESLRELAARFLRQHGVG